jgi:hypothetical protein
VITETMTADNPEYPKAAYVIAFGRNKIGKTEPGALEGKDGETGVLTSKTTLELPITEPPVEVNQMLKINGELAVVIGVRRLDEKRVEATFRSTPGATRYLDQLPKE